MSKNKKKRTIKKTSTEEVEKIKAKTISFSFKYLDTNHSKFPFDSKNPIYWQALIRRLSDLSKLTRLELIQNSSKALRFHKIDWKDTSEKSFGLPEKQRVEIPYQFSVSSNEYGRVHGFFIHEVFYIVWLDPNHQLYPRK